MARVLRYSGGKMIVESSVIWLEQAVCLMEV